MGSIAALEEDVRAQVRHLPGFRPQRPLGAAGQKNALFCGSGDSLAACMLAEAFSGYKARAIDPLDLSRNGDVLDGRTTYIVSISGRTISNIAVAKRAPKAVAITSNPDSRLARACSRTIRLGFPNSDAVTAGSTSFLESALTCISLVHPLAMPDARKIFKSAESAAAGIRPAKRVFFLGNMHTYPVAMYAAAKMYEVLGAEAYYERLEQFSHMELFSARKGDTVVIMEERTAHNTRLAESLRRAGLDVIRPNPGPGGKVGRFLFHAFLSQLVPLAIAKERRRRDCHFMTAGKLRRASDEMIY